MCTSRNAWHCLFSTARTPIRATRVREGDNVDEGLHCARDIGENDSAMCTHR